MFYGLSFLSLLLTCVLSLFSPTGSLLPQILIVVLNNKHDIKYRIWQTRCDSYINCYILFFLTFYVKLVSWQWSRIAHLFSVLRWQLQVDFCSRLSLEVISRTNLDPTVYCVQVRFQYFTITLRCLISPFSSKATTSGGGSRPSRFCGHHHSVLETESMLSLLGILFSLSSSSLGMEASWGERYLFHIIVGSGVYFIVGKYKSFLYNNICHYWGFKVCMLLTHIQQWPSKSHSNHNLQWLPIAFLITWCHLFMAFESMLLDFPFVVHSQ